MASFAELDENNIVLRVIAVNDSDCLDENNNESEAIGIVFCHNLLGGRWIQTSINNKIRKNFAGIGYTYDSERDAFIAPQPFTKWVFNEDTCKWEPPVSCPVGDKQYTWNDNQGIWEELITN